MTGAAWQTGTVSSDDTAPSPSGDTAPSPFHEGPAGSADPAGSARPADRDAAPQYVLPLVLHLEKTDPPARTDALRTAARAVLTILADELPVVPMFHGAFGWAVVDTIRGFEMYEDGIPRWGKIWFES